MITFSDILLALDVMSLENKLLLNGLFQYAFVGEVMDVPVD